MTKPVRFPSLDGWRAVSILLVLAEHSKNTVGFPKSFGSVFNLFVDGSLGVRFFFVISGFLITHLLLQEQKLTQCISLKNFYIRRALRILPVYFVFLLVIFMLQTFTRWHQPANIWVGNLTFTTDFAAFTDPIPGRSTTEHLWSLAVEEQFYGSSRS